MRILATSILCIFVLFSCTRDRFEGIKLKVKTDVTHSIGGQIKNAANGLNIASQSNLTGVTGDVDVSISISGPDANQIVSIEGEPRTSFTSKGGFVTFGINPDAKASVTNPLRITVVASAPNYLSTSTSLLLTGDKSTNFVLSMVEIGNEPNGVESTNGGGTIGPDGVTENLVVSTPISTTSNTNASVSIPKNLKMYDENGAELSGSYSVSLVYFNNMDQSSLDAFPGGFVANMNGSTSPVLFTTGGFIALEIEDQSGKHAVTFNDSILIEIKVNAATINPTTTAAIQDGEEIPILSYNTSNGEWSDEQIGTIGPDPSGEKLVSFYVNHLSYWNLDWKNGDFCYTGIKIKFKSNKDNGCASTFTKLALCYSDGTPYKYFYHSIFDGSILTLLNAPAGLPSVLKIYSADESTVISSTIIPNLCASGEVLIQMPNETVSKVTVRVEASCEDLIIVPSVPVWYRENSSNIWNFAYVENGMVTFCNMKVPGTYVFGTYYDNQFHDRTFEVTENDVIIDLESLDIDGDVCGFLKSR